MKKAKLLALILALAIVFSVASGCSTKKDDESSTTVTTKTERTTKTTTSAATTAATTADPNLTPWGYDKSDIYVIKTLGGNNEFFERFSETEVGAIILEKFGIDFEGIPFTEGREEKARLLLASGTYYDIQLTANPLILAAYMDADVAVSFDDYLDRMPNFQRIYELQIPTWRSYANDGQLYTWDVGVPIGRKDNVPKTSFAVRADALDLYAAKYGWDNPPKYTDDYIELLTMAKEAGLTDLQGNPCIGLTAPFGESFGLEGIAMSFYENNSNYIPVNFRTILFDRTAEKLVAWPYTDLIKNTHRFWNTLYNLKLLDEEAFTDKGAQTYDKALKASPIAIWYAFWNATPANPFIVEAGAPEKQYVLMQPGLQAEDEGKQLKWNTLLTFNYASHIVTDKSPEPGRIFELMDYLCSDEGAILAGSGIEGVHWNYVNGVRTEIQSDVDKAKEDNAYALLRGIGTVSAYGLPFFAVYMADGELNTLIQSLEYQYRQRDPENITNIYAEKYGRKMMMDWIVTNTLQVKQRKSLPNPQFEPGSRLATAELEMKNLHVRWMYDIWTSSPDEFDTVYEAMLADYSKLEVEAVLEAYEKAYMDTDPDWKNILSGK